MVHQSFFKRNKYGNIQREYNGHKYHSGFEAEVAAELDLRIKGKDIKSWERQVKIPLTAHGKHICNYYIDFVITHNDESKEYLEVKGFGTALWQLKWKIFEAQMEEEAPGSLLTVYRR